MVTSSLWEKFSWELQSFPGVFLDESLFGGGTSVTYYYFFCRDPWEGQSSWEEGIILLMIIITYSELEIVKKVFRRCSWKYTLLFYIILYNNPCFHFLLHCTIRGIDFALPQLPTTWCPFSTVCPGNVGSAECLQKTCGIMGSLQAQAHLAS